jgi:uncharacterized membrane protein YcfT
MGRNLYVLAATLFLFSLVTCGLGYSGAAPSQGDRALWHVMGLVLLVIALIVTMAGMLTALFEQAERRAAEERRRK